MYRFISALLFLSLAPFFLSSQEAENTPVIPDDFCISKDEYRVYQALNEYRQKEGLAVIPISKSLSYVAKVHTLDLHHNHPDTSFCSLSSWSDMGIWKPCCHSRHTPDPQCILNKPKELTNYTGEGHELSFWDNKGATPDSIVRFFLDLAQSRELILNTGKWSYFSWKAVGVAIYKNYASIWFGESIDMENEPAMCGSGKTFESYSFRAESRPDAVRNPTGRYYIIFGSFVRMEDAERAREQFRREGFPQARVIVNENTFRVSLSDHATMEEAQKNKASLGSKYREAWIARF